MIFKVLFWNIWLDNQINGVSESSKLLDELKRLVNKYQPDFIGLNEVLQASNSKTPFVSDFLTNECDYKYNYFAPASPFTDEWLIGAALYSRIKFVSVKDIAISKDTPAEKRGYKGFKLKAIAAKILMPSNCELNIIVAHPMHLRIQTIKDHYEGTANLEKLIRSSDYLNNTILGGDMNEPGFMPKAFKKKVDDVMHFRTGSKTKATWHHNAHRFTPIRANLDQLYWSKNSNFTLKKFEVLDSVISDHRPIFASFEYK